MGSQRHRRPYTDGKDGKQHAQRTRKDLRSEGHRGPDLPELEDKKYFHAEVDKTKKPFTIVIPPPNITGQLHMGHALDETMQDIIIRFKRMQGYNALWQPGTDHASIATEVKIIGNSRKRA
jgi:isoleucyl-tRNA synthetase